MGVGDVGVVGRRPCLRAREPDVRVVFLRLHLCLLRVDFFRSATNSFTSAFCSSPKEPMRCIVRLASSGRYLRSRRGDRGSSRRLLPASMYASTAAAWIAACATSSSCCVSRTPARQLVEPALEHEPLLLGGLRLDAVTGQRRAVAREDPCWPGRAGRATAGPIDRQGEGRRRRDRLRVDRGGGGAGGRPRRGRGLLRRLRRGRGRRGRGRGRPKAAAGTTEHRDRRTSAMRHAGIHASI